MAKASWVAPLVAALLGCLTRGNESESRSVILVMTGIKCLLILAGLGLAVAALFGLRRGGRDGVLGPAITGLVINSLVIGLLVMTFTSAAKLAKTRVAQSRAAAVAKAQQMGQDAVMQYPGWLGFARPNGGVVAITEFPDESPAAREFQGYFSAGFSAVSVALDNSAGLREVQVDPGSLVVFYADGHTVHALPPKDVLSTATEHPEQWQSKFGANLRASAGSKALDGYAFLPKGTSLVDVTRMTIVVNDQETIVSGKYLSVSEKEELMSRAAKTNKAAP